MATVEFAAAGRNDGRLYRAVACGDYNSVLRELRLGDVDLALKIDGKSFLRHAGERGFKRIADALLQHGFDPNEVYGKRQRSLLHFSAATFNYGFASVLLEHGANPSHETTSGATALHFAARTGQTYLVKKLVDAGADVNAEDKRLRTPLSLAFSNGMTGTAKVLADRGARHATRKGIQQRKSSFAEPLTTRILLNE